MIIVLLVVILFLLLENYVQAREIKKLKTCISFDKQELINEAVILMRTNDSMQAIKQLRKQHYPLSLLQAKKIVDQAMEH
ncbi:MAG: hypothetical protein ABF608_12965 [Sporolactobacillus sp.]